MAGIYDLSVLKRHLFSMMYHGQDMGPLASAPIFQTRRSIYDCVLYKNGQAVPASFLEQYEITIRAAVKDTNKALSLLQSCRVGMDLLATDAGKVLTFTPVGNGGSAGNKLTFFHAVLQPDFSYSPSNTADHRVELVFGCHPEPETGEFFTLE